MHRGGGEGIVAAGYIQNRQRFHAVQTQKNIQIAQAHIGVDAQHPLARLRKTGGDAGAQRGFARAALAGNKADHFTQIYTPPILLIYRL